MSPETEDVPPKTLQRLKSCSTSLLPHFSQAAFFLSLKDSFCENTWLQVRQRKS
jgi:hypothetical protein